MVSSGVMWSQEIKRGLLNHMPNAVLSDGFSSSEAIGMGNSIMTKDGEVPTAKFVLSDRCRVFDENDQPVALPDSALPINLPDVPDYAPRTFDPDDAATSPEAPLGRNPEWVTVTLDLGDGPKQYRRDTNTMPN